MQLSATQFTGNAFVPPSKSYAHRAIIAASLAYGTSLIKNIDLSNDILATIQAMRTLGAKITVGHTEEHSRSVLTITGRNNHSGLQIPLIDCHESGSTLRFLIPVVLSLYKEAVFTGSPGLARRSLAPYQSLFRQKSILWKQQPKQFPIQLKGQLYAGDFPISGKVSSQLISGLMFALPLLEATSTIHVTDALESKNYVMLTMDVLQRFGITIRGEDQFYEINPEFYHSADFQVEGDWSQAAFLLIMGVLGGRIAIHGLNRNSNQGDRVIESILTAMNGKIYWEKNVLFAEKSELKAVSVDVSQCPDLAPALAGVMALARGRSTIKGGKRLRDKESDRISSVVGLLNQLGAVVTETEEGMIIDGVPTLHGASISSHNDHRLAMMAASLSAAISGEKIDLAQASAVAKSWPDFYQTFKKLGGQCNE
ncbi:3-phosphoshikimate 1-carboxyvinyltransferase [Sporolactobacillus sp. CPB3-1]|uniref:3-phosphoshikimate 1-carboxyvinyltransferase n=1 Tax=Sporolactobacillus mangiferae TaxID=2940498 RepID=A0ABT0MAK5_9BACL|nr:3-phosphoshikimate 1-carboxyvinyltransferase [Sporolactobacillus mangiferae]MCL1631899.1 3-phosphoshikimate 1-carboxyvinyltransferase [Sporolactobacillus mangiferae]